MNFVNPLAAIKVFAVNNLCRALLVLHIRLLFGCFFSLAILHRLNFKTSTTTMASTATIRFFTFKQLKLGTNKVYALDLIRSKTKSPESTGPPPLPLLMLRCCCYCCFSFWLIIRRLFAATGWSSGKQLVAAGGMRTNEWAKAQKVLKCKTRFLYGYNYSIRSRTLNTKPSGNRLLSNVYQFMCVFVHFHT